MQIDVERVRLVQFSIRRGFTAEAVAEADRKFGGLLSNHSSVGRLKSSLSPPTLSDSRSGPYHGTRGWQVDGACRRGLSSPASLCFEIDEGIMTNTASNQEES